MKKIYIMTTTTCNLSCPHCDIKGLPYISDKDKQLQVLQQYKEEELILFGGEPWLEADYCKTVIDLCGKISISTNLLLQTTEDLDYLSKHTYLATSWNVSRFNPNQYKTWINNLSYMRKIEFPCTVLITMTPDLIYSNIDIVDLIKSWNLYEGSNIGFEYLVDNTQTQQFYFDCDKWLANLNWDIPLENLILSQTWCRDCTDIFTLLPNGELIKGCPQFVCGKNKIQYKPQCLTCDLYEKCSGGCMLQKHCTYPFLLKGDYNGYCNK